MTDGLSVFAHEDRLQFAIKAVPGASRDRIVGLYGDALKVQTTAPPEDGRANARIVQLLARALGVPDRDVTIASGASNPRKVIAVSGLTVPELEKRLRVSATAK